MTKCRRTRGAYKMLVASTVALAAACSGPQTTPQSAAPVAEQATPTRQLGETTVNVMEGNRDAKPTDVFDHLVKQGRGMFPSFTPEQQTDKRLAFTFDLRDIAKKEPSVKAPPEPAVVRMVYELQPLPGGGFRTTGRSLYLGSADLSKYPQLSQMAASMPMMLLWSGQR